MELPYKWSRSEWIKGLKNIPCKPDKVLGKIPFSTKSKSKRISNQYTNHKNNTKNNGKAITEFEYLKSCSISENIFNTTTQKYNQTKTNAILSDNTNFHFKYLFFSPDSNGILLWNCEGRAIEIKDIVDSRNSFK